MTDARTATAFHEAGHAVACIVQDLVLKSVTIKPRRDGSRGACIYPPVLEYECNNPKERRSIARKCIIIAYAGMPAERLVSPHAPDWHGHGDDDNACWLSREYHVFPHRMEYVGDEYHDKYLNRLRNEARRLVMREKQAIIAVAEELLAKKTINGRAVEKVIKRLRSS